MAYYLLLLILLLNIKMSLVNKKNETSFGLVIFGFVIPLDKIFANKIKLKQINLKSIQKSLSNAVLWKNITFDFLEKTVVEKLHITCYYPMTGEVYENYLYVFTMTSINHIRNLIITYTKNVKEQIYRNIIKDKYDIDFLCVFKIRIINIIIVLIKGLIKYIGGYNGSSS